MNTGVVFNRLASGLVLLSVWSSLRAAAGRLLCAVLYLVSFGPLPAAVTYQVFDLGTFGGNRSEAYGINNRHEVAGFAYNAAHEQAFRARNGVLTPLPLPASVEASIAYGLNEGDGIVGRWFGPNLTSGAFLVNAGSFTALPDLPNGGLSVPYAVNLAGTAVGSCDLLIDQPFRRVVHRATRWGAGGAEDLGPTAVANSVAYGINDAGIVAGYAIAAYGGPTHAWLFAGAGDIHNPALPQTTSIARAVNNAGTVVGYANVSNPQAFVWTAGNGMTLLPMLPGFSTSQALAINSQGVIAGFASGGNGVPVIWTNGQMIELQSRIPANSGWDLDVAYGINDSGVITGYGSLGGQTHAFLLYPTNLFEQLQGSVTVEATDVAGDTVTHILRDTLIELAIYGGVNGLDRLPGNYTDAQGRFAFLFVPEQNTYHVLKLSLTDRAARLSVLDFGRAPNETVWLRAPLTEVQPGNQRADLRLTLQGYLLGHYTNFCQYRLNEAQFMPVQYPAQPFIDGSGANVGADRFVHDAVIYARLFDAAEFATKTLLQPVPPVRVMTHDQGPAVGPDSLSFTCSNFMIHASPSRSLYNNPATHADLDAYRHEYGHAIMCASPIGGVNRMPQSLSASDGNHGGIRNSTSADSWVEGFATWMSVAMSLTLGEARPDEYHFRGGVVPALSGPAMPRLDHPDVSGWNPTLNNLAEEFAISSALWEVQRGTDLGTVWNALRAAPPQPGDFKDVYESMKGNPAIAGTFAFTSCAFTNSGSVTSGVECVLIDRGFYQDANGNGVFDFGEKVGVTRWGRADPTVARPDPPAIEGSELWLNVAGAAGGPVTDCSFRVRLELDPPLHTNNSSYRVDFEGPPPYRLPIALPGVPSRAVISALRRGYAETTGLVVRSEFFLAQLDPSRPGGVGEFLLTNTFSLPPTGRDVAVLGTGSARSTSGVTRVTISAVVTNFGPLAASNVVLLAFPPPGAQDLAVTLSQGTVLLNPADAVCQLGSLAALTGARAEISFRPAVPGGLATRLIASATGTDVDLNNNTNLVFVRVPSAPVLSSVTVSNHFLVVRFDTESGLSYDLEYTDTLSPPAWQPLASVPGDGAPHSLTVPISLELRVRFYRVSARTE